MDILISANEMILAMTQVPETRLVENMTEEEYTEWLDKMVKVGVEDGKEV